VGGEREEKRTGNGLLDRSTDARKAISEEEPKERGGITPVPKDRPDEYLSHSPKRGKGVRRGKKIFYGIRRSPCEVESKTGGEPSG